LAPIEADEPVAGLASTSVTGQIVVETAMVFVIMELMGQFGIASGHLVIVSTLIS